MKNNQSSASGVPLSGSPHRSPYGRAGANIETTQALKDAITHHFVTCHGTSDIDFRTVPSTDDYWQPYRMQGRSFLFPPQLWEITVFLADDFDSRWLGVRDTRRLRAIAKAHGFIYRPTGHYRQDRLWFVEPPTPAEILAQEMAMAWMDQTPCRRRPNPFVFIDATRIFLGFLKWHGEINRTEIDRAKTIIRRLVSSCNPYLVRDQYIGLVRECQKVMAPGR